MTRSKIQKMKFFLFLLIFLLAQAAVSKGSFREKRVAATAENKDKLEEVGSKIDEQPATVQSPGRNGGQQTAAGPPVNSRTKPVADTSNRTHNITSKPSGADFVAANKTSHVTDAANEVCFKSSFNCTSR